jgi:predicted transcriptional regulator
MSLPAYIPVSQIMRKEVTFVNGRTDVFEALRIMKKVKATCLIVEKRSDQDEYGMLVFSDVAKEVLAKDRAPERVNVYEIMAKPIISVRPDMDVRYCARLFNNFGISHAPVIENDEVLGIVSYYVLVLEGLPNLD